MNQRLALLCKKQGWLCHLCGTEMKRRSQRVWHRDGKRYGWPQELWPTIDHDLPKSLGGSRGALQNMRAAHWICNQVKNNRLIASYPLACYEVHA